MNWIPSGPAHQTGLAVPALEARGLSKSFGTVRAANAVSFAVHRGSITGFLGPNGSGKSTTLRMMLALVRPDSGSALVGGVPFVDLPHPARVVGAVLDAQSAHPKRTARAHLRMYAPVLGLPDSRVDQVLALVGLSEAADRKAGQFSLGMRQRLALATALLGEPDILVLDEPANGLDPEGIAWLREFLRSFARSGRTVLISSHVIREVEQIVDHVVVLDAGSVVFHGSVDALRGTRPRQVFVSSGNPAALALGLASAGFPDATIAPDGRLVVSGADEPTIAAIAGSVGVDVFGMVASAADLEQIFLSMTQGRYASAPPQQFPPQQFPPQQFPPQQFPPQQQFTQPQHQFPPQQGGRR